MSIFRRLKTAETDIVTNEQTIGTVQSDLTSLQNIVSGLQGATGDMTKLIYDTDDDGRVDKAESVDDGINFKTALEIKTHLDSLHAPSNAEQNVNADWDAGSGDAQILNKPTVPTALSQ